MNAIKTMRNPFYAHAGDVEGAPLLSINDGVPISSALEAASCLLNVVQGLLQNATDNNGLDQVQAYAVSIIVDQAKAAMDAAWSGIDSHTWENQGGAQCVTN